MSSPPDDAALPPAREVVVPPSNQADSQEKESPGEEEGEQSQMRNALELLDEVERQVRGTKHSFQVQKRAIRQKRMLPSQIQYFFRSSPCGPGRPTLPPSRPS